MIDPNRLKAVRLVVTHDNCADGLACAILARDALPEARIEFMQHTTEPHRLLPAEPGILFCDFAPMAERVSEFVDVGSIVLDHHRSAKPIVDAFGTDGIFGDEKTQPGICGASLVYEHLWKPLRGGSSDGAFAERFSLLAGVVDTWQRQSPFWEEARIQQATLTLASPDFWLSLGLAEIARTWETRFRWAGEARTKSQDHRAQKILQDAHRFTTPTGTRVVLFQGVSHSTFAAELIDKGADLVVGFSYRVEDGHKLLICSTRSHTTFDCASFARSHGGGGHTKAAGFSLLVSDGDPNPYSMFEHLICAYEAVNTDGRR